MMGLKGRYAMSSYTIGNYFENFIKEQITVGRFNNGSEVVREGLRLVEERERKLQALKNELTASVERGGRNLPSNIISHINKMAAG